MNFDFCADNRLWGAGEGRGKETCRGCCSPGERWWRQNLGDRERASLDSQNLDVL